MKLLRSHLVIARREIPAQSPLEVSVLALLALRAFDAPGVYWVMAGALLVVAWAAYIIRRLGEHEVSVLDTRDES